jgi:hypothetical protein
MALRYRQKPKLPEDPDEVKTGIWYRLDPKYRREKSFYGKATIMFRELPGHEIVVILQSYETEIAICDKMGLVEKTPATTLWGEKTERKLSCTSSRHFNAFKSQAHNFVEIMQKLMENKLGPKAMVL